MLNRSRLLWSGVAVLAVVLFAVSILFVDQPVPAAVDPAKWTTPRDCAAFLVKAGHGYEAVATDKDGVEEGVAVPSSYILRRKASPISWPVLRDPQLTSVAFVSVPGHLYVSRTPEGADVQPDPSFLQVGRILLRGHPDELRRVANVLR